MAVWIKRSCDPGQGVLLAPRTTKLNMFSGACPGSGHFGHQPWTLHPTTVLWDPNYWILGKPVPATETVSNRKDLSLHPSRTSISCRRQLGPEPPLTQPCPVWGSTMCGWGWWQVPDSHHAGRSAASRVEMELTVGKTGECVGGRGRVRGGTGQAMRNW